MAWTFWRHPHSDERADADAASVSTTADPDFAVLAEWRRVCILTHLVNMEALETDRAQLVEVVFESEIQDPNRTTQPDRDAIDVDLHHHQLPRLEQAGLITYDWRHGTVQYDGSPVIEKGLECVSADSPVVPQL